MVKFIKSVPKITDKPWSHINKKSNDTRAMFELIAVSTLPKRISSRIPIFLLFLQFLQLCRTVDWSDHGDQPDM